MKSRIINVSKFVGGSDEAKLLGVLLLRNELLTPHTQYEVGVDGYTYIVELTHSIAPRQRSNHKNLGGMRYSVIEEVIAEGTFAKVVDIATLAVENGMAVMCKPTKRRVAKVQTHTERTDTEVKETARFDNECKQTLKAEYLHAKSPYRLFSNRLLQSYLVMRKFDGPTLAVLIAEDAIIRNWYPLSFKSRMKGYQPRYIMLDDRISYSINLLNSLHEQAHARNVVNLDVKPDNAIVNPMTKKITLVDLGCARDFDEIRPVDIYAGTDGYIAPEVNNWHPRFSLVCKPEADLYSVGVSLRNLWGDNCILFEDNAQLSEEDLERGLLLIDDAEQIKIVRHILVSLTLEDARLRMPLMTAIELFKGVQAVLSKKGVMPMLDDSTDSIHDESSEDLSRRSPR